jgi:flavin-dependent dehydrogenase
VTVRQPDKSIGIKLGSDEFISSWLVDATGHVGVLRRSLGVPLLRGSPPMLARYGYCKGSCTEVPLITGDTNGWIWIAQVARDRVAWVQTSFGREGRRTEPPAQLEHLPTTGELGVADVTWRVAERLAGCGFFLCGDAAAVLDPSCSHGVLRALMSGMMAAHLASECQKGRGSPETAARAYERWLRSWLEADLDALRGLHETLRPTTRAAAPIEFTPVKFRLPEFVP